MNLLWRQKQLTSLARGTMVTTNASTLCKALAKSDLILNQTFSQISQNLLIRETSLKWFLYSVLKI